MKELVDGLGRLDIFGNGVSSAGIRKDIDEELAVLNNSLQISSKKVEAQTTSNTTTNNNNNDISTDKPTLSLT